MKISVNRLCKLAGIESGAGSQTLTEGSNRAFHEEPYYQDEVDFRFGKNQLAEGGELDELDELDEDEIGGEGHCVSEMDEMDEDMDEVIEVDERELVQELRRAKRIMQESRSSHARQVQKRAKVNTMIEEEVSKLLNDYNLGASWVYGDKKPTRSRPGRITRSFPGIGFGKF